MTVAADTVAMNIMHLLLFMVLSITMEDWLLLKNIPNSRLEYKHNSPDPIYDLNSLRIRRRGRGWEIEKKKGRPEEKERRFLSLLTLFLFPGFPLPIPLGLIRRLWPKRLKNHTLWGPACLYSPYKGVPPGLKSNDKLLALSRSKRCNFLWHIKRFLTN